MIIKLINKFRAGNHRLSNITLENNVTIIGDKARFNYGENCLIQTNSVLHLGGFDWSHGKGCLSIGDNVVLGYGCVIIAAGEGGVVIGNNFDAGPGVKIFSSRSDYSKKGNHVFGQVRIGNNVICYANVVISPGVSIGDGAVIAAGSVVNKDIPVNAFAGGTPAEVLRILS